MAPRSVALIGASTRPGTVGNTVAANLAAAPFKGQLGFVNPKGGELLDRPLARSIAALGWVPDLAVVAAPPATVPDTIAELGRLGTRAAVVITAGITGDLRQRMLDAAKPYCLRVQGPNCLGLMVPPLGLNASFVHRPPLSGELAFISQSGALVTAMVDWAAARGIGFSHIVSLGDMADADFGDLLDYLAGDARSRAILLYMEAVTAAPKFLSAARRAARAKPVIVIKSGRHDSGQRAAHSHTGALAGSDAAYEAAFRRAGVLRVRELDELFGAAEILARAPRLGGERLTILTNGGGAGVLAVDRLADERGRLAMLDAATLDRLDAVLPPTWSRANPVDIIGDAPPERFVAALNMLMEDRGTDAVLVIDCPTALADNIEVARAVIATVKARQRAQQPVKPLIANWLGEETAAKARRVFGDARIPSYDTPDQAVHAYMQLVRHARAQTELMRTPSTGPVGIDGTSVDIASRLIADVSAAGRTMLTEVEAKHLIAAYGIATVPTIVASGVSDVDQAAEHLLASHGQIVIKILSEDISHKSDVGGVRLGISTAIEAREAAAMMLQRAKAAMPSARIQGFTVQPMIHRPRAHELLIGMSDDTTFGPVIMFGAGGTAVEVLRDTALALPPLDHDLALDLIGQTRICHLLEGYRDRPAADIAAIADVLVRTSAMLIRHREILELDINPLIADDHGVIALDARVRIARPGEQRRPLSIRPYPDEWRSTWDSETIGLVELRPIRPFDETRFTQFLQNVSPADMRLRFFTPRIDLSHAQVARFTQIDYAREMAFVAVSQSGEIIGVSRIVADPDYRRAEYGILVRTDVKGRGLGWQLMDRLISYARTEGLSEIHGAVLSENGPMLKMCRELGFTVAPEPGEPTLRRVTLALGSARPASP